MTERWISQKKHYCEVCRTWLSGHVMNVKRHEMSERHIWNMREMMKEMKNRQQQREADAAFQKREIRRVEAAAAAAMRRDAFFEGSVAPAALPGSQITAQSHEQQQQQQQRHQQQHWQSQQAEQSVLSTVVKKWGPWLMITDAASGLPYYFNSETRTSVWTPPPGFPLPDFSVVFSTSSSAASTAAITGPVSIAADSEALQQSQQQLSGISSTGAAAAGSSAPQTAAAAFSVRPKAKVRIVSIVRKSAVKSERPSTTAVNSDDARAEGGTTESREDIRRGSAVQSSTPASRAFVKEEDTTDQCEHFREVKGEPKNTSSIKQPCGASGTAELVNAPVSQYSVVSPQNAETSRELQAANAASCAFDKTGTPVTACVPADLDARATAGVAVKTVSLCSSLKTEGLSATAFQSSWHAPSSSISISPRAPQNAHAVAASLHVQQRLLCSERGNLLLTQDSDISNSGSVVGQQANTGGPTVEEVLSGAAAATTYCGHDCKRVKRENVTGESRLGEWQAKCQVSCIIKGSRSGIGKAAADTVKVAATGSRGAAVSLAVAASAPAGRHAEQDRRDLEGKTKAEGGPPTAAASGVVPAADALVSCGASHSIVTAASAAPHEGTLEDSLIGAWQEVKAGDYSAFSSCRISREESSGGSSCAVGHEGTLRFRSLFETGKIRSKT